MYLYFIIQPTKIIYMSIFFFPDEDPQEELHQMYSAAKVNVKMIHDNEPIMFNCVNQTIFDFMVSLIGAAIITEKTALCPNGCSLFWHPASDALPVMGQLIHENQKITIYGV
jgi:hypothetical protein